MEPPDLSSDVVVRSKKSLLWLEQVLEFSWLNGKSRKGKTALLKRTIPSLACLAVENNDFISLQVFLERMDVNCGTYDGMRPLHKACELGNLYMVKFLMQKGASPQLVNWAGKCSLYMAVHNRHFKVIRYIQMRGFTVNLHPMRIAMEMISAVKNRDYHLLHAWSLSGMDMDSKDYNGCTGMHVAVSIQDKAMISKLLEYGATPLEKNVWGKTAMDDARNDPEIFALFHPLLTVRYPTKEAYLLYREKYFHK